MAWRHDFTNKHAVFARFQLCDYVTPGELGMALVEQGIAEILPGVKCIYP
jgi:hypothetical protein